MILWAVVVLWMAVIFSFSAQSGEQSAQLSGDTIRVISTMVIPHFQEQPESVQLDLIASLQFVIRKAAHFSVYLILGVLVMVALGQHTRNTKVRILLAQAICTLYAASDEFHQLFIDGRGAQIQDVLIDSVGALTGIALVFFVGFVVQRRKHRKTRQQDKPLP